LRLPDLVPVRVVAYVDFPCHRQGDTGCWARHQATGLFVRRRKSFKIINSTADQEVKPAVCRCWLNGLCVVVTIVSPAGFSSIRAAEIGRASWRERVTMGE